MRACVRTCVRACVCVCACVRVCVLYTLMCVCVAHACVRAYVHCARMRVFVRMLLFVDVHVHTNSKHPIYDTGMFYSDTHSAKRSIMGRSSPFINLL